MQSKKILHKSFIWILITILFIVTLIGYQAFFEDKFYPTVFIGNNNVTMLTKQQAEQLINNWFSLRSASKINLTYQSANFTIDLSTSSAQISNTLYLDQAFQTGHTGPIFQRLDEQLKLMLRPKTIKPEVTIDLTHQFLNISKAVYKGAKKAAISLNGDEIVVIESQSGLELEQNKLKEQISDFLISGKNVPYLPIKVTTPNSTTYKAHRAKDFLNSLSINPITLTFNQQLWVLDKKTTFQFVNLDLDGDQFIDQQKLQDYVSKEVTKQIDQEIVEALFKFDTGNRRVVAFKPAQQGQKLDQQKTVNLILLAIAGDRPKNITLPINVTHPKSQTEDVNNLGIKELIGQGISNFAGSIPNRIYNVNLTAQKINGVLIPPNQTFSFNQTVGDITEATGFKKAYVIKEGRTVLDDGGGVCQVSTTLFRAVLNAGLPIVKRTAHAYRVGYYEQGFPPGLDATVFYPSVDFQFKNDTGKHILIQAYTEGLTLYVDLYGSSDGRITTMSTPVVANQTPPPSELRQDDPQLPRGVVKQVDWPAWGATVTFKRTVTKGSEKIIDEAFRSNYKAWQAVYLVGTMEQ